MSLFSSPQSVAAQAPPTTDPAIAAQREDIARQTAAANMRVAERARRNYEGRTMGTQGANAMFTNGPMGYGRTMGTANV